MMEKQQSIITVLSTDELRNVTNRMHREFLWKLAFFMMSLAPQDRGKVTYLH